MATIYKNGQIVYSGNEYVDLETAIVEEFPRDPTSGDSLDYQQIVITIPEGNNKKVLEQNYYYHVTLTIPRDVNFNLDYGLRLLTYPSDNVKDLDELPYQLIKYITVPRIATDVSNFDTVILYQHKTEEEWDTINTPSGILDDIKVGILLETDPETAINQYGADYLANKIIIDNESYYQYQNGTMQELSDNIGKNTMILVHSWKHEMLDESTFEFIISPLTEGYNALYMCLVPDESIDRDIQWKRTDAGDTTTYYGRYIDDISKIKVQIKQLNNILPPASNNIKRVYTNIGVWSRPELMLAINGAEIKIGPSGYFELRDYSINSLCVAAFDAEDKYTIDYQYKETTEGGTN